MSLCQNIIEIIEGNISQNVNKILSYCEHCKPKNELVLASYQMNICKNCEKIVCNMCIEKTRKKCILCVGIDNKVCEKCGNEYLLMMCHECGEFIKICNEICENLDFDFSMLCIDKAYCRNCSKNKNDSILSNLNDLRKNNRF